MLILIYNHDSKKSFDHKLIAYFNEVVRDFCGQANEANFISLAG